MNSEFTDEQIKAYSKNFREGDAVWCDGKWRKVVEDDLNRATPTIDSNKYILNWLDESDESETERIGAWVGFRSYTPYRVTTLKDYKLQGGEKIVWLGESGATRTLGKSYTVSSEGMHTDNSGTGEWVVLNKNWGVIPRYEQVKEKGDKEVSNEIKVVEKSIYTGKFKVGDRVKVVAVTEDEKEVGQLVVGEVEEVISIYKNCTYQYKVNFKGGGQVWFNEATLELVQDSRGNTGASNIKLIEEGIQKLSIDYINAGKYDEAIATLTLLSGGELNE